MVVRGCGEGAMVSYCLLGKEFHLGKIKSSEDGWVVSLHNNVNVIIATEVYILKYLKW